MGTTKTYWKGIEELEQDEQFVKSTQKEFSEEIPVDEFLNDSSLSEKGTSRRDFLKTTGMGAAAIPAAGVASTQPVQAQAAVNRTAVIGALGDTIIPSDIHCAVTIRDVAKIYSCKATYILLASYVPILQSEIINTSTLIQISEQTNMIFY